jgi:hypothetical protein
MKAKALAGSILQQVRARLPEPLRQVARRARAVVLQPFRAEEALKQVRAQVAGLEETVRLLGDSMAESSAYWGRALEEVRDSFPARTTGDELAVAYAIRAFSALGDGATILSLGGGDGSVERALAFLGHRVVARPPWPALWPDAAVVAAHASEPWASIAAAAGGLVATTGPGGAAELPLEELSACAPGTRLVVRSARAVPEEAIAGWRLQDVRSQGGLEGALMTLVHR